MRPWSLRELVGELTSGITTPIAAWQRARARTADTEHELRAWVSMEPEPEFDSAAGLLRGVPLGVKDIIDVAGLATRCGSALRADAAPASADAAIVSAWRHAGAVPIGKTVTTEFAFFAPGPTQNPARLGHTPGGSSSGSAAAVASGQVPLAIGSQTAGSVTRPASFCGVAALVMSRGRLPVDGVTGLSPSLDSHGVFAATVSDLALAWSALTDQPDPALSAQRAPRLLVWNAASLDVVAPEMRDALQTARNRLTEAGAETADFLPERLVSELTAAHPVVMAYEAARERAVELAAAGQLSEPLATLLLTGAATSVDAYDRALQTVAAGRETVAALFDRYDAILGPAAPGAAPAGLAATGDPILSRAWQALGLPTVTVPALRADSGLPLGLQLIGPAGAEEALLAAGCWVEAALRG
ncbi:amidase [Nocardia nova]|uniref:Amidase n=1 Tax=Nocardia nova TaxID=37330 RepID=A0A2S6AKV2_9NOCA|nr:amidase [Nocardia nova]PPJ22337.1 amidase [Nocardia nova]PPJ35859.1 amidase [Nocardia nova]